LTPLPWVSLCLTTNWPRVTKKRKSARDEQTAAKLCPKNLKRQIVQDFTETETKKEAINAGLIAQWALEAQQQGCDNNYEDRISAYDQEANELATTYCKLECRAICEGMQERLPRELRDMIYEYILPQDTRVEYFQTCSKDLPRYSNGERLSPHLLCAEYLGGTSVAELGETWYRVSELVFWDYQYSNAFLQSNPWKLSSQPTKLVCKVVIEICVTDFMTYIGGTNGEWDVSSGKLTQLHRAIANLSSLRKATKVALRFRTRANYWVKSTEERYQQFVDVIESIASVARLLQKQGYQIKLLYRDEKAGDDFSKSIPAAKDWIRECVKLHTIWVFPRVMEMAREATPWLLETVHNWYCKPKPRRYRVKEQARYQANLASVVYGIDT
jgi:hypothetical protein